MVTLFWDTMGLGGRGGGDEADEAMGRGALPWEVGGHPLEVWIWGCRRGPGGREGRGKEGERRKEISSLLAP